MIRSVAICAGLLRLCRCGWYRLAGLAQSRRGEWSYYNITVSVSVSMSGATGDVVASRVTRGLRREDLNDSEAAYVVANDAVFAAIETWTARRG